MLLFSICLFCNHFKSFSLLSTKTNKKDLTSWLSSLFYTFPPCNSWLRFFIVPTDWCFCRHHTPFVSLDFCTISSLFFATFNKYTWRYIFWLSYLFFLLFFFNCNTCLHPWFFFLLQFLNFKFSTWLQSFSLPPTFNDAFNYVFLPTKIFSLPFLQHFPEFPFRPVQILLFLRDGFVTLPFWSPSFRTIS